MPKRPPSSADGEPPKKRARPDVCHRLSVAKNMKYTAVRVKLNRITTKLGRKLHWTECIKQMSKAWWHGHVLANQVRVALILPEATAEGTPGELTAPSACAAFSLRPCDTQVVAHHLAQHLPVPVLDQGFFAKCLAGVAKGWTPNRCRTASDEIKRCITDHRAACDPPRHVMPEPYSLPDLKNLGAFAAIAGKVMETDTKVGSVPKAPSYTVTCR